MRTVHLMTILWLGLGQDDGLKINFTAPGWYCLEFTSGQHLTIKVLERKGSNFRCFYQGAAMPLTQNQIQSLIRLGAVKRDLSVPGTISTQDEEKIRDAIENLVVMDDKDSEQAFELLRQSFAQARSLLHEALSHRENRVRKLVVKLLGEEGEPAEDLQPVLPLLKDSDQWVRLAVVIALRKLTSDSIDSMMDYLHWEPVAGCRKMAIKTVARWRNAEAVRPLIGLLDEEKDEGVRKFIFGALNTLSGQDLGDDAEAWKGYLEGRVRQEEVDRLEGDSQK